MMATTATRPDLGPIRQMADVGPPPDDWADDPDHTHQVVNDMADAGWDLTPLTRSTVAVTDLQGHIHQATNCSQINGQQSTEIVAISSLNMYQLCDYCGSYPVSHDQMQAVRLLHHHAQLLGYLEPDLDPPTDGSTTANLDVWQTAAHTWMNLHTDPRLQQLPDWLNTNATPIRQTADDIRNWLLARHTRPHVRTAAAAQLATRNTPDEHDAIAQTWVKGVLRDGLHINTEQFNDDVRQLLQRHYYSEAMIDGEMEWLHKHLLDTWTTDTQQLLDRPTEPPQLVAHTPDTSRVGPVASDTTAIRLFTHPTAHHRTQTFAIIDDLAAACIRDVGTQAADLTTETTLIKVGPVPCGPDQPLQAQDVLQTFVACLPDDFQWQVGRDTPLLSVHRQMRRALKAATTALT